MSVTGGHIYIYITVEEVLIIIYVSSYVLNSQNVIEKNGLNIGCFAILGGGGWLSPNLL